VVQLREAAEAFKEAAELAGELGSPVDLARAALGAEETEANLFRQRSAIGTSARLAVASSAPRGPLRAKMRALARFCQNQIRRGRISAIAAPNRLIS
jgi:hypothetical protein